MKQRLVGSVYPMLTMVVILMALAVGPVRAAEPAYPPGSKLGLVPPPGMEVSKNFVGFEDRATNSAALVIALPAEAYESMDKSATPENLQKEGIVAQPREPLTFPFGKGFLLKGQHEAAGIKMTKWLAVIGGPGFTALVTLQVPDTARATYTDDVLQATIASLTIRDSVPVEEQLALVPFRLTQLADFRIGSVVPGRAIMLTDAQQGASDSFELPRMVISAAPGQSPDNDDRDVFARRIFSNLPGIKEVRISNAEPLRIGGQQGYQIMATAKDARTDAEISLVQWLRFGSGGFLHLVATAPTPRWPEAFTRFRAVRDGVNPK